MIDDYRGLAVFVAIADAGSLTAAGKRLKLSTSVVSHHLSRLEDKLGVTLFFRSTRSMSLTPEGHAALDPARRMMAAGEEALSLISAGNEEPVGTLHVTMPAWGEQLSLRQALWAFAKAHPLVSITLHSSDVPADLVKGGFDLAIRLGTLADSSLKSRRLGHFETVLVAAPDYLDKRPAILSLRDLVACDFVGVSMLPGTMLLQQGGRVIAIEPEHIRLEVDTIASARSAVLAGLGIRHLPLGEVAEDIAEGRLIRILPDWSMPELGVFAVWPDSGPQKALTRRLIDFLVEEKAALMP
ncbi:LysR family transcriptional regulator [Pseudohalocynthiibacter aestuariivivens]|nr:LysR family transcriptional regulator [Pseudohalocynthiibacter aestuariivivens]QIE45711.1 LysR family transcriptional regulator [Pseudohalocynthiibacter aestuariivivens]